MLTETESTERHEETLPVFMMGDGGLVIERADEPETQAPDKKPMVDENPVVDERLVVDEKLMRFTDDSPSPSLEPDAEAQSKQKPARKLTLPASSEWRKRNTMCVLCLVLVSLLDCERVRMFALTSPQTYAVLTACQGEPAFSHRHSNSWIPRYLDCVLHHH